MKGGEDMKLKKWLTTVLSRWLTVGFVDWLYKTCGIATVVANGKFVRFEYENTKGDAVS